MLVALLKHTDLNDSLRVPLVIIQMCYSIRTGKTFGAHHSVELNLKEYPPLGMCIKEGNKRKGFE